MTFSYNNLMTLATQAGNESFTAIRTALRDLAGLFQNVTLAELNRIGGITAGAVTASKALVVDANKDLHSLRYLSLTGGLGSAANAAAAAIPVFAAEVTFTETAGAGTYTGSVIVPAGSVLLDIIINGVALWDNAGAVTMTVGDTDPDGFFTGIDLKATDLLAGESLSFALAGGKAGAYIANSQVSPRYSATARTITGTITTASTGGSTGRTRMNVVWMTFPAAATVAATKA